MWLANKQPAATVLWHLSPLGVIHDTIKQRLRTSLLVSASGKNVLDVASQLAGQLTDEGTWKDLHGCDPFAPDADRHGHLARTLLLAKARHLAPGELDNATRLAFDWWLAGDYRSADWHLDQLTVPRMVGEIALLFEEALSTGASGKVIEILTRSRWAYWASGVGWTDWTGAPVLGVAYNVILRGCLENSSSLCEGAFRRAFRNVQWSHEADWEATMISAPAGSFQASDPGMTRDYARLMTLAHGTAWQAPADSAKAFFNHLLDFQQWTMWRGVLNGDVSQSHASEGLGQAIARLSQLGNPPRRAELADLAERLIGTGKPLVGHRHFWKSQLTVHQRPTFFSSLCHDGTSDSGPFHEETLGGTAVFLRTGHEYNGLAERSIRSPSASTVRSRTDLTDRAESSLSGRYRTTGGVGEGEYGMTVSDLNERGLRGKKAWLFFENSVVCLEAGVQGSPSGEPVFASINRCRLSGPVVMGAGEGNKRRVLSPAQRHDLTGVQRIEHGGFLYYFPGTARVVADLRTADGREQAGDDDRGGLFTLSVNHGTYPQGASSACLVLPWDEEPASRLQAETELNQVEVVANSSTLQAVRHRGLGVVGIAFWEPGVLTLPGGGRVAANSRCLLLCRDQSVGSPTLNITNLLRHQVAVHVEYGGRCLCFELPGGADAGRGFRRQL